ncbi:hypothetical protein [Propionivibrio sp.]|uniref:hypothetical protein n=1 Tax=Propionivibrio sp. TaxID=2212460 RepID=UPI003BEF4EC6
MTSSKKQWNSPSPARPSAATKSVTENLEKLKTMMANATDFSEPMYFFMDHLVTDNRFMGAGEISHDAKVAAMFGAVSEALYRQVDPNHKETARKLLICKLAAFNFYHGAYQIGKQMATLIYYPDVDQGMVAMASLTGSGLTVYSRFSEHQFSSKDYVNFVPGNRQQTH